MRVENTLITAADASATGRKPSLLHCIDESGWPQWLDAQPQALRAWLQAQQFKPDRQRWLALPPQTPSAATEFVVGLGSGPAPDLARAGPVFQALGRATRVGPHGAGQLAKLANQMIVGVTIGVVAEALLLCAKGGADMAKVKDAITGGFADSRILQVHGQRMIERDFAPRGRISVQLKDMRNAMATAQELGFDAPITGLLESLYASASENGLSGMDQAAFFAELARRNGMA